MAVMITSDRYTVKTQPVSTDKAVPVTRDVRIGVLGCGYWGPKLARNFYDMPGVDLAAICDKSEERLESVREIYPDVPTTREYRELLDSDLDGIVLATPVMTHYPLAKAALLAGKHVLVEKPITSCSAHAEELMYLASERGLTLMVGHTFVYNPAVEAVRDVVQSNELGSIFYLSATRANLGLLQPDINVIWDLGPHDVSMLRYILGENPTRVSAHGGVFVNRSKDLHEVAYLVLTFPNGIMANGRYR